MRLLDADNISFYCNYEGDCTEDIDDFKKMLTIEKIKEYAESEG